LLVIVAFLVIIGVWIAVIRVSHRIDSKRLTPTEEAQILGSGGQRHD
jgi:hypothetical protein